MIKKNQKSADVVDMFMGYKDSGKRIRIYSAVFKRGCNSAAADAAIYKDTFSGSADEARISGTSAGYGKEFCQNKPPKK